MKKVNLCRVCSGKLKLIYRFGKISLIGNFSKSKKKQKKYNISLNYCDDCFHIQIAEIIDPKEIFKNYLWETGISKTNLSLIDDLIKKLGKYKISKNSNVLEVASNDGTLVNRFFKKTKCKIVGIDPAKNLSKLNYIKSTIRLTNFFNFETALKMKRKYSYFDFIIARNVIAHIENPNEIFKGVETLLKEQGIFVLEVPHLYNIFKYNQYDNIFHEHIGFHSLKSILDLANLNNLKVINAETVDSQGGSIRCYISRLNSNHRINISKIKKILKMEINQGLMNKKKIMNFKKRITNHKFQLLKLIKKLKEKKQKISAYGASGKGLALYQFSQLNNSKLIDFIFDKSYLKIGKYAPGSKIKVCNPKTIARDKIDYLLLLTWNLKKEILKQEKKFLKLGGKFILPFPLPKIIK